LDPRCFVFGGDTRRWAIVRPVRGFTVCLGVRDAEQFAEQARRYLQEPAAEAVPVAGGE
jgi:hypothetical protein